MTDNEFAQREWDAFLQMSAKPGEIMYIPEGMKVMLLQDDHHFTLYAGNGLPKPRDEFGEFMGRLQDEDGFVKYGSFSNVVTEGIEDGSVIHCVCPDGVQSGIVTNKRYMGSDLEYIVDIGGKFMSASECNVLTSEYDAWVAYAERKSQNVNAAMAEMGRALTKAAKLAKGGGQ